MRKVTSITEYRTLRTARIVADAVTGYIKEQRGNISKANLELLQDFLEDTRLHAHAPVPPPVDGPPINPDPTSPERLRLAELQSKPAAAHTFDEHEELRDLTHREQTNPVPVMEPVVVEPYADSYAEPELEPTPYVDVHPDGINPDGTPITPDQIAAEDAAVASAAARKSGYSAANAKKK